MDKDFDENTRAVMGGNFPPEETPVEAVGTAEAAPPAADPAEKPKTLYEHSQERVGELVETANRWAVERPKISDDEMASKAKDFLTQITAELKAIDSECRDERAPFEKESKAIAARYKELATLLEAVDKILRPRLKAFAVEKQRQIDEANAKAAADAKKLREDAEAARVAALQQSANVVQAVVVADQLAAAAIVAEKAAKAAPKTARIQSSFGGRASGLRTTWSAEITDWDQVYLNFSEHIRVREVLQSLANEAVRGGAGRDGRPGIPGVTPKSEQNV
jgi:hypothetical protein